MVSARHGLGFYLDSWIEIRWFVVELELWRDTWMPEAVPSELVDTYRFLDTLPNSLSRSKLCRPLRVDIYVHK